MLLEIPSSEGMTGDNRENVTDFYLSFAVTQELIVEYWPYVQRRPPPVLW